MGSYSQFLLLKAVRLVMVLIAVAIVAFSLVKLSPIDPVNAYLGADIARAGPEQRELIAEKWGLNQPAGVQFKQWLSALLSGDLGWSMTYNAPVADVLASRLRSSAVLMIGAWLISGLVGFALGLIAGARPNSAWDRIIRGYSYLIAATPTFWLAILLLIVFSVGLQLTPVCCAGPIGLVDEDVTPFQRLHHLILPLVTLSAMGVPYIALHTRAKMVEIMQSDIALFAKAQGATTTDIVIRHGARNASLPVITVLFASLGELFGGSILAETVFSYPGLGRATMEAGIRGDVPLLLAITLFTTLVVSCGNIIADAVYQIIDPRLADTENPKIRPLEP
ncbi:MAG: ABC transporter permease [Phyllobacterium sp.]